MELHFAASGAKKELDFFETQLQCIPFGLPFKDVDGKDMIQPIYGILEPMRLYRYVFPKEELQTVLKTLELDLPAYQDMKASAAIIRKMLGLDKIPEVLPDAKGRLFDKSNIAIIPVGIKEDPIKTFPNGKTHESI